MVALAFLLAALLGMSGAVKARSGARVGIGPLPGTLLELVGALVIAGYAVTTGGLPWWLIAGALGLFLASSVHHVLRLRAARRQREMSEGGRLAAYVKYLSASDDPS